MSSELNFFCDKCGKKMEKKENFACIQIGWRTMPNLALSKAAGAREFCISCFKEVFL